MAVTIRIPTTLRILTSGEAEVSAKEGTIAQIIDEICENYPDFQGRLIDEDGKLLRFVNMYVEDEDVRFLQEFCNRWADDFNYSCCRRWSIVHIL